MARLRAIIAIDQATAEDYRARYPTAAERIHVVPNAVGDEWVIDSAAGARARADGPPVFLFAGRLSVEKRVDLIIRAIAGSHGLSGAKLVIAGAGPEEARLRRLANGSEVQFLGEVVSRDLASLYRRVDALVLASEYEGLPTVMLEALASGCPVVAMSGWGAEALLHGGRGVVATRPQDLSLAMLDAVRMRRKGQPIHLPIDFVWSRVGNRVLEVYERVWREAGA